MSSRHSTSNALALWLPAFLGGLLLGGLAGAVTAMLMAPRSGEKTRSQLMKRGATMRQHAEESVEEAVSAAGDMAHAISGHVQDGVVDLQKQAHSLIGGGKK